MVILRSANFPGTQVQVEFGSSSSDTQGILSPTNLGRRNEGSFVGICRFFEFPLAAMAMWNSWAVAFPFSP